MDDLPLLSHSEEYAEAPLLRVVLRPEVRFVGFGENHWWNNPQRHFVKRLLSELARAGYGYLALEIGSNYQALFENFAAGNVSGTEFERCLQEAAGSIYRSFSPCPGYFGMLEAARRAGMTLLAVDKDRSESAWYHPEFAEHPRDRSMAELVIDVLQRDPMSKVIFYGGSNHLYRRPADSRLDSGSMAEHIEDFLRQRGEQLYCMAAELPNDKRIAGLTFAPLYMNCEGLGSVRLVATKELPAMEQTLLGKDRRCPWGACIDGDSNECPGLSFDICQSLPLVPILAGYWDAFALHPVTWMAEADPFREVPCELNGST